MHPLSRAVRFRIFWKLAGLYIHIPFCRKKCPYCSFVSYEGRLDIINEYVCCLIREAEIVTGKGIADGLTFDSVYFGGGTPSLLPAGAISKLLDSLSSLLPLSPFKDKEISFECNPESVRKSLLTELAGAGINRVSLGVQDLTEKGLAILGRVHSVSSAKEAARLIRDFGFENFSIDIIYCLPGQDISMLELTLEQAFSLEPVHISAYELSVEGGTRLYDMVRKGKVLLQSDESRLHLTRFLEALLEDRGIYQYEISNFAEPGRQCSHNINYWKCGQYLGIGCGAVSYLNGTRYFNTPSLYRYMTMVKQGHVPVTEEERLDGEARFREAFVMWLRMTRGADLAAIKSRFGLDPLNYYGDLVERMCAIGLMVIEDDKKRLRLSNRGRYIANYVLSQFV